MLGLFERIGEGLEMVGLAVEGAVVNAKCEIANAITDIEVEAKCRKYEREAKECDDSQIAEEEDKCKVEEQKEKCYKEMLEKLAQHEEVTVRNPVDIAIELGYSEDDVKEAFEYLQKKLKVEMNEASDNQNKGYTLGDILCGHDKMKSGVKKGGGFFGNYVTYDTATEDYEET